MWKPKCLGMAWKQDMSGNKKMISRHLLNFEFALQEVLRMRGVATVKAYARQYSVPLIVPKTLFPCA